MCHATDEDTELQGLKGALYKRKDFLDVEEEGACKLRGARCMVAASHCRRLPAKLHPARAYYYRANVDIDKIIEQCTRKVCGIARCCLRGIVS